MVILNSLTPHIQEMNHDWSLWVFFLSGRGHQPRNAPAPLSNMSAGKQHLLNLEAEGWLAFKSALWRRHLMASMNKMLFYTLNFQIFREYLNKPQDPVCYRFRRLSFQSD